MATTVNPRRPHPRPVRHRGRAAALPRRSPLAKAPWRLWAVWLGLLILGVALFLRLAHLQLWEGPSLRERVAAQHQAFALPPIARRDVLDRQGQLLATDRIRYQLYGHPALFQQALPEVAAALSPLLERPVAALLRELQAYETGIPLGDDLSGEVAQRIRALGFDGLELVPRPQRFYPQGALFGSILGFVNVDGEAQAGLELTQVNALALPRSPRDPLPAAVMPVTNLSLNRPTQLQLTLDSRLQQLAQSSLEKTLADFSADRGTVMVMDVNSGEILALAVTPSFDPNRYYESPLAALRNWAVTDFYEPGSTFKPINLAIALEAGAIEPTTTVYDEGRIFIDGWPIQNADYESSGRTGSYTLAEVMQYSSNIGMVRLMEKMPAAEFYDWLKRLGMGEPTGVDLPGEVPAPLKTREQFLNSRVDSATVAFGQGVVVTPIKLLQLYGTVVNGGRLITPHVVRGLVDGEGILRWQPLRPAPTRIFSPQTSQVVLETLEAVVKEGTGRVAQIPGYRIGGKTGTAQKVTAAGTYGDGRIVSFAGVIPIEHPQYVVLAVIDDPAGGNAFGSTVAAPLVKDVMAGLIRLEGIPPSGATQGEGAWLVSPPLAGAQ